MISRTSLPHPVRMLATITLLAWASASTALPDDQDQPINIEADGVEIDDGRQLSIYSGQVELRQGSMHLWADRITVHHKASRHPNRIVVEGKPARFRQLSDEKGTEVKAKAMRMEYDSASEKILLIDQAKLTQGKDIFASDRILYDRNKAVVKAGASAKGKKRVRISITPGK